jgi:acetyl esterase/lipase
MLASYDKEVMNWLFGKEETRTFNLNTTVGEIRNYSKFRDFGRLIFPVDRNIPDNEILKDVGDYYVWYNYIDPDTTVEVVNYMKERADSSDTIFYQIYSEAEMKDDPEKQNTGLFFFGGNDYEKTAIVNAGGGFMYVGAMHDSFPHALELSKMGYNAFALIYRPGSDTACEDLARAIAFLYEHQEELKIDMDGYSLWGGSAGARMAAWHGSLGTSYFGEKEYPRPGAVIMQYTGLSQVFGNEPPTYNCVGTADGIASYRTMEARIRAIQNNGTAAEIEVFKGLPHGFGLGTGTVAEGWINNAVEFWINNIK